MKKTEKERRKTIVKHATKTRLNFHKWIEKGKKTPLLILADEKRENQNKSGVFFFLREHEQSK